MAELRWTPQAADDLEAITNFIALDSVHYASLVAMEIVRRIDALAAFPLSGRTVPELNNPSIREILVGNYRVIYRLRDEQVELLTIWHGARLMDPGRFT